MDGSQRKFGQLIFFVYSQKSIYSGIQLLFPGNIVNLFYFSVKHTFMMRVFLITQRTQYIIFVFLYYNCNHRKFPSEF